jgi:beta-glucanase (GH16 family)
MTYQDLGVDYTRYYNPFSDSRRSSYVDNRTSTPRNGAHTTGTTTPLAALHPANPFRTPNASTTRINTLYDPEKNHSIIDDRLSAPYEEKGMAAWPLIGDEEEDDDEMHMPRDDDNVRYKPKLKDHLGRDNLASTIGLAVMLLGLLFIFVALPVMSSLGVIDYNSSMSTPLSWFPNPNKPEPWAIVNDKDYPFLANVRVGLIDPDTPKKVMEKKGAYGDEYELVFSDEFNKPNRTFWEGDDPYFYAANFWYGATEDLEWYDPDAVTTYDGTLELRMDKFKNHGLEFRSGMLNSWNHLCFKGGIFEISVSLPGPYGIQGLWPGAWTLGNLGRPGYLSTTDGIWPYSYDSCDAGITPNQSAPDGLSNLPGQRLPSCTCAGEDHPSPGTGRGAPEIDIIEVSATWPPLAMGVATQSLQVAPFDVHWYPNYNFTAYPDQTISSLNSWTGGPYQEAISGATMLNRNWYDGQEYQKYSFEYAPGTGQDAFITWAVGDQTMWGLDGRAIGPNGNIAARPVSEEPMSMILNLGMSNTWTSINWEKLVFPAVMRIDYVRIYQKKGEEMITCDPPGYETTEYIRNHKAAYTNTNYTVSRKTCGI